ncbi:MAG: transglycosylase SLT domain-containing protein [Thermoflexales bacterium]|nr:transglycosylase SLT domain-containing protein [Thermoflexales bacterium]
MDVAPERKRHFIRIGIGFLVLCGLLASPSRPVLADPASPPAPVQGSLLSSYWNPAVARWEPIILEEARRRGIDPDFIAAVIWTESLGRPHLHSPAGAVGLMGVMPKEAGFSWRPTAQELEDPALNVFWGTRTLSIVIRQARGDLYLALAAYNGGWEQVQFSGPRRYAEDTLLHYARAVAVRMGLPADGPWVATLAAVDPRARTGMTVLGPQYPLTRYSARPIAFRLQDAGVNGRPTALVFAPRNGEDMDGDIGLWLWWNGQVLRLHEPTIASISGGVLSATR